MLLIACELSKDKGPVVTSAEVHGHGVGVVLQEADLTSPLNVT